MNSKRQGRGILSLLRFIMEVYHLYFSKIKIIRCQLAADEQVPHRLRFSGYF